MLASELRLFKNLRTVSRSSILFGILLSLVFIPFGSMPLTWQIALAVFALTIGIPHGAVDHLVTIPKHAPVKMILFHSAYLIVFGLAVWAILSANLFGFQLVVLMSAIHFGIGDAAFISEMDNQNNAFKEFPKLIYAFAAGFTPVLIPLVNDQSAQALEIVNPKIVGWAGTFSPLLFVAMVAISALSILWMIFIKRYEEATDLALLLILVLVAPPLVAFAFYFGLWHALRHTGRLTLELESAQQAHQEHKSWGAFNKAFSAGMPAAVIVIVFTLVLGLIQGFEFQQQFFWYLLVVIWALTVPHMALTARLDIKALRHKSR
jgi:Brp/Blh family beta-carotene 15,15'-monooxygenase